MSIIYAVCFIAELKKLRIEILHTYRCQKYPISPDSIFLSRLTGELTFSRMKNTDVEVMTKKCGDLCGKNCSEAIIIEAGSSWN